jgi:hypothetical protein
MAHVNFNHLNASAFNSFVPVATKTANNQLFKNVLIVGGLALVVWGIYKAMEVKPIKTEEERK